MSVSTNNAFAALRLDDDGASEGVKDGKKGTAKWVYGDATWADECVGSTPVRLSQCKQRCEVSDSLTRRRHWHTTQGRQRRDDRRDGHDASDT